MLGNAARDRPGKMNISGGDDGIAKRYWLTFSGREGIILVPSMSLNSWHENLSRLPCQVAITFRTILMEDDGMFA